jgi:general secretion pathway protein D
MTRPYLLSIRLVVILVSTGLLLSCAAGRALQKGDQSAFDGDWDSAVEHYRRAVQEEPRNADYRVALQRAMLNASRAHFDLASEFENGGALADAAGEYRRAAEFDPSNSHASGRAVEIERALRDEFEASLPPAPIEGMRARARQEIEAPLLDPTSGDPLDLNFVSQSLKDILEFIGNATGINVIYDQQFQDRLYSVRLDGVTIEEALNQILTTNQAFYKVLSPRSLVVVPETPQKRAQYEEQVIRTFYISNADVQELSTLLSQVVRVPQMAVQPQIVPNITSNTITVRATTAVVRIIEQVIAANDKPRAEIVVDIEILEVNRERAREFGLDLKQYSVGAVYSRDALGGASSNGPTFGRNFFSSVPAAAIRFLETDSETRLVAQPQLRGQEGSTLTLNLGDDIPVPTTAFTPIAMGGATVNPLTSFTYRPVGVIVEMTPRVTYENEIILDLEVENSTLGPNVNVAGQALPTFGTRRVITRLRLRDGESNLLAGLLREEDRRSLRGFPGILRLPIIRQLLSANDDTIKQTDIIMLLTPRIIRTHELTQENLSPIYIGTQGNIGVRGPPPLIESQSGNEADPDDPGGGSTEGLLDEGDKATEPIVGSAEPRFLTTTLDPLVGPKIGVELPAGALSVGSGPYTVPISVTGASQVSTLTLSLSYDPTVLRVNTVREGSFMRQGGARVTFVQKVDGADGRVDLALSRSSDPTGASGSGLVAAIIFEAIRPGSAILRPSGLGLTPGGVPLALGFDPATVTVR